MSSLQPPPWASGNVYYKGVRYSIASGSIDNTKFWIYWQISNPGVFQASASYPALTKTIS